MNVTLQLPFTDVVWFIFLRNRLSLHTYKPEYLEMDCLFIGRNTYVFEYVFIHIH